MFLLGLYADSSATLQISVFNSTQPQELLGFSIRILIAFFWFGSGILLCINSIPKFCYIQ